MTSFAWMTLAVLNQHSGITLGLTGTRDDFFLILGMTNGYHPMAPKRPSSLGMVQVLDLNAFVRALIYGKSRFAAVLI